MNYNINSGYGMSLASALHMDVPVTGKLFVVGDSSTVNLDMIKEMFVPDPDGKVRFFATIDDAVGACTADAGDVILVAPGHTETVSAAGGLTLDVSGVTIVGMGNGDLRPQVVLDTAATADIAVSADNIKVRNMRFEAAFADVATIFEIGAAENFTVENCEVTEQTTDENFVNVFRTNTTDNAADGLTVRGCHIVGVDTANEEAVLLQGDIDGFVFEDNYVNLGVNDSEAIIGQATGKDMTNVQVIGNKVNRLNTAGDLLIENDTTANSGVVANNFMLHADTAGEVLVDADGVGLFNNYATAVVTASGYILPAVDS